MADPAAERGARRTARASRVVEPLAAKGREIADALAGLREIGRT